MADRPRYPRGGYFNGMGITLTVLAVAVGFGAVPGWRGLFAVPLTPELLQAFQISVGLMVLHKVESNTQREFDVAPVYLRTDGADVRGPREALFRMFVATFLAMLVLFELTLHGGQWPMLLLGVWIGQGLQELHHLAKTLAHRAWYAGTLSGLLFSSYTLGRMLPLWTEALGWPPTIHRAVWAALPAVVLVLWLEHRRWIRRTREIGLPVPYTDGFQPG